MSSQNIYILKDKDCTDTIESISGPVNGKYRVIFRDDSRIFEYNLENVIIETIKNIIESSEYLILVKGEIERNIIRAEEYDSRYRLIYGNNFVRTLPIEDVELIGSCFESERARAIFEYYKTLASRIGLRTSSGKNILATYYNKVDFVRNDAVLTNFLIADSESNPIDDSRESIFPFSFNLSQMQAVNNAMKNRISVIQGPPGTGKTQTILNIIANVVDRQMSVAVVSSNNSAIDNIYEKLNKLSMGFLVAKLGNSQNKNDFITSQQPVDQGQLESWKINYLVENNYKKTVSRLMSDIEELLSQQYKRASLRQQLDNLNTEETYFKNFNTNKKIKSIPPAFRRAIDSNGVLDFWHYLNKVRFGEKELSFWSKLKFMFVYKVRIDKFFTQDFLDAIKEIQLLYYSLASQDLENKIKELDHNLSASNIDTMISEHQQLSEKIFKSHTAHHYNNRVLRRYSVDDLWQHSESFIKDYPIILSTTYSLRNSLNRDYVYDYVIVDEASQVDLATFVLALSCAKRVVIVGDEKQLPNVIDHDTIIQDRDILKNFDIPKEYKFSTHSALSATLDIFNDQVPQQLLREHYRCHSKIINYCNRVYYDNQLIVLTNEDDGINNPLVIYKTVKGNHARHNHVNERQIEVTLEEMPKKEGLNLYNGSSGIVTPYRNQAEELKKRLKLLGADDNVLADTVDKFQGRERDVIIINTVDNKISKFVDNPNRLNVAISRARKQLIMVVDNDTTFTRSGIGNFLDYIRYNNGEIVDSEIKSIFDNLYTAYYDRKPNRKSLLSRILKNKPVQYSEELMDDLIQDVLSNLGLGNIGCVAEYPIYQIIDTEKLPKEELRVYARKSWTSVDYLFFLKTSKIPILAVEVDGWKFHDKKEDRRRDEMKDEIFQFFNIPLERFATTGSSERKRLISILRKVMNSS